ncbi:MAG: hypothetical protein DRJ44_05695 [Thermoprotei archaeon]|nr:MAG: hypothetical protein DRJ44_05695 [Thermoprotei archaeon]
MRTELILERSKIRLGYPIRGYVKTDRPLILKLIITAASLLPSKARGRDPYYNVIVNYVDELRINKSREFEFHPPEHAPPTVSTRNFLIGWSLVAGVPRFGGRILYPRNEIRLVAVPPLYPRESIEGIDFRNDYAEPGKKFTIVVNRELNDPYAEVIIEEWYKGPEKGIVEAYTLDVDVEFKNFRDKTMLIFDFPPLICKDEYLIFYPLTFTTKYKNIEFGIRTKVEVGSANLEKPITVPIQITL